MADLRVWKKPVEVQGEPLQGMIAPRVCVHEPVEGYDGARSTDNGTNPEP